MSDKYWKPGEKLPSNNANKTVVTTDNNSNSNNVTSSLSKSVMGMKFMKRKLDVSKDEDVNKRRVTDNSNNGFIKPTTFAYDISMNLLECNVIYNTTNYYDFFVYKASDVQDNFIFEKPFILVDTLDTVNKFLKILEKNKNSIVSFYPIKSDMM